MLDSRKSGAWLGLPERAQSSSFQLNNEAQRGQVTCLRGTARDWMGDRLPPKRCLQVRKASLGDKPCVPGESLDIQIIELKVRSRFTAGVFLLLGLTEGEAPCLS